MRLVNAFSPDSKAFYSHLWRRQAQTQQRAYASGCTAHRSRLESIAQSVNVAERLRKARISFVTTNYDVANAHPSPSHASLSEALVETQQDDTGLQRQRHELATIQGADESILIRPAQPRAVREQRMPFTGCTTNVLTNGQVTCEPNCCRRRSFSSHLLRSQICSTRLFYGTHNLRRRCACYLDHHGAGPYIVASDGEQCCPGQCAGRDGTKHSEARTLCLLCRPTCPAVYGLP